MWAGVPGLLFACLTRCLCVPLTLALTVLGVACLGAGIPLWIKGNQRLSDVADNYNQMYRSGYGYSPRLDFGPAAHGIGFTLRF